MRVTVTVNATGMYGSAGFSTEITEPFIRAFEPIKTCDDPLLSLALREPMPHSVCAVAKLQLRKDAAKELAGVIAEALLAEMIKHDTHNGYKVGDV